MPPQEGNTHRLPARSHHPRDLAVRHQKAPPPTDDPPFEPGFYCLFCKALRYRGQFGRPFSDFLALSQHFKHAQCVQRPVLAFYRKVLQWNREKVIHKIIEEGLCWATSALSNSQAKSCGIFYDWWETHPSLHSTEGLLDPNAPAWHPFPEPGGRGRGPSKGGYRPQGYLGRDFPRMSFELRNWGCYC